MSIKFQVEEFSGFFQEATQLLEMHYEEVAAFKELLKLNPNREAYLKMEQNKMLCTITARDNGRLVGYIVMMIHPHLHYRDVLVATDDVHFLHPDYRKGSTGVKLIKFAMDHMKTLGAQLMALRTKVKDNHGLIFERLGFIPVDVVYLKRLEA